MSPLLHSKALFGNTLSGCVSTSRAMSSLPAALRWCSPKSRSRWSLATGTSERKPAAIVARHAAA
eukprot:CAMPEP_0176296260 /NCGR_PEP_ID=MMETSP0121_2-20121125/58103_1 /TAXON_ID=160619 /ORGANISM="Kryptoperidinium foliaceum, Strain CCMP 1326" /LENGTH=64 /DNA_ID=CAMNT_0017637389 /DNA_START=440 /DNA_END=631 /DNA_ORIENTATION=+